MRALRLHNDFWRISLRLVRADRVNLLPFIIIVMCFYGSIGAGIAFVAVGQSWMLLCCLVLGVFLAAVCPRRSPETGLLESTW